jgi:hypothetical protein
MIIFHFFIFKCDFLIFKNKKSTYSLDFILNFLFYSQIHFITIIYAKLQSYIQH